MKNRSRKEEVRRPLPPIVRGAVAILFVLLLLLLLAFAWLPAGLEQVFLPRLARQYGLELQLDVRRIGWSGLDLGDLRFGSGRDALRIDSIRVDYSPRLFSLSPRLAAGVVKLSGGEITLQIRADGKMEIQGLENLSPPTGGKRTSGRSPVFEIKQILIRHTRLTLRLPDRVITLPVDAVINSAGDEIRADVRVFPGGREIRLKTAIKSGEGGIDAGFDLAGQLDRDLAPELPAICSPLRFQFNGRISHNTELTELQLWDSSLQFPPASRELTVRIEQLTAGFFPDGKRWSVAASGGLSAPEIGALSGEADFRGQGTAIGQSRLALSGEKLKFKQGAGELLMPRFKLSGDLNQLRLDTALTLNRTGLPPLAIGKITGEFPPRRPRLEFSEMKIADQAMGRAEVIFDIGREKAALSGAYHAGGQQNLALKLTGSIPFSSRLPVQLELNLPAWSPEQPVRPALYYDRLDPGMSFSGTVAFGGRLTIRDGQVDSGGSLMLRNVSFSMPRSKLKAEGVDLDVRFLDLLSLRTAPEQRLSFDRLTFGDILLEQAELRFQLDSPADYLLESAQMRWCGGTIGLRAVRLGRNQRSIKSSLYCDHLQLTQLLSQLGVVESSGDGALSGRLPVELSSRGIAVTDGYLQSDPGVEGSIRTPDAGKLLAAVGAGGTGRIETDLAGEALKDFKYQWAKLQLNTDRENFHLKMQLEGRPAGPLPFGRDAATGELVRSDAATADIQGLTLNINLTLPLNRLLKINEKINFLWRD